MIIDTGVATAFILISIDGREIRLDWFELAKLAETGKLNELPGVLDGTWGHSSAQLDQHEGYDSVVAWLESCGLSKRGIDQAAINAAEFIE